MRDEISLDVLNPILERLSLKIAAVAGDAAMIAAQ